MDDKNLATLLEMISSRDAQIVRLSRDVEAYSNSLTNERARLADAKQQIELLTAKLTKEVKQ